IERAVVVVAEITTGDHSKRTDRSERTRFRTAECVLAITIADDFALEAARQVQIACKWFTRIGRPVARVTIAIGPTWVMIPFARVWLPPVAGSVPRIGVVATAAMMI